MRKTAISVLVSAVLVQGMALAAPVNPLVRPAALAAPAQGNFGNLPSPPMPGMPGGYGQQQVSEVKAPPAALPRYTVVAIANDIAVLRVLPGAAAADPSPAAQPMPGMVGYGAPTASANATSGGVVASLLVKHKQRLQVADQEVQAEIADGVVTLKGVDTGRVLFAGRVDGAPQRVARIIMPEPTDMGYVARQTAGGGASSAGTAPVSAPAGGFGGVR